MTRPTVRWDGYYWVAALDHGAWVETEDCDTWEQAMDWALWHAVS